MYNPDIKTPTGTGRCSQAYRALANRLWEKVTLIRTSRIIKCHIDYVLSFPVLGIGFLMNMRA